MNSGKICISVADETVDGMIAKIKRAEEFADVIEVRFDSLQQADLNALHYMRSYRIIDSTKIPIISTFRPLEHGGYRNLTWDERRNFWNSGFETYYCDVEEKEFVDDSWSWLWTKRIYSHHDYIGESNPQKIFDQLAKADTEIIKIAVKVSDATDAIPVWNLLQHSKLYEQTRPWIIPIAMGEAGKWTRILGLAHGAFMTYASLDAGNETADGQVTAKDLIDIYRVKELDRDTQVYGVIGDPVSGSLSPYLHNPAFQAAGLNSVFLHLQVKGLDAFIRRMVHPETREVELNFAGFSVTMPHKQAIMAHLDEIDPAAEKIGAVNTVKIVDGKLKGFNTDAGGFIKPLKEKYGDLAGARAAVAGAGGAARAVVHALKQEGVHVTVLARDAHKAAEFARNFDADHGYLGNASLKDIDILVNATPLGMKGPNSDKTIFTAQQLSGVKFVYDLVTRVTDTPLIREAKAAGIPAIGGMEMLIAQAEMQFEIWTGSRPRKGLMKNALLEKLQS